MESNTSSAHKKLNQTMKERGILDQIEGSRYPKVTPKPIAFKMEPRPGVMIYSKPKAPDPEPEPEAVPAVLRPGYFDNIRQRRELLDISSKAIGHRQGRKLVAMEARLPSPPPLAHYEHYAQTLYQPPQLSPSLQSVVISRQLYEQQIRSLPSSEQLYLNTTPLISRQMLAEQTRQLFSPHAVPQYQRPAGYYDFPPQATNQNPLQYNKTYTNFLDTALNLSPTIEQKQVKVFEGFGSRLALEDSISNIDPTRSRAKSYINKLAYEQSQVIEDSPPPTDPHSKQSSALSYDEKLNIFGYPINKHTRRRSTSQQQRDLATPQITPSRDQALSEFGSPDSPSPLPRSFRNGISSTDKRKEAMSTPIRQFYQEDSTIISTPDSSPIVSRSKIKELTKQSGTNVVMSSPGSSPIAQREKDLTSQPGSSHGKPSAPIRKLSLRVRPKNIELYQPASSDREPDLPISRTRTVLLKRSESRMESSKSEELLSALPPSIGSKINFPTTSARGSPKSLTRPPSPVVYVDEKNANAIHSLIKDLLNSLTVKENTSVALNKLMHIPNSLVQGKHENKSCKVNGLYKPGQGYRTENYRRSDSPCSDDSFITQLRSPETRPTWDAPEIYTKPDPRAKSHVETVMEAAGKTMPTDWDPRKWEMQKASDIVEVGTPFVRENEHPRHFPRPPDMPPYIRKHPAQVLQLKELGKFPLNRYYYWEILENKTRNNIFWLVEHFEDAGVNYKDLDDNFTAYLNLYISDMIEELASHTQIIVGDSLRIAGENVPPGLGPLLEPKYQSQWEGGLFGGPKAPGRLVARATSVFGDVSRQNLTSSAGPRTPATGVFGGDPLVLTTFRTPASGILADTSYPCFQKVSSHQQSPAHGNLALMLGITRSDNLACEA